MKKILVAIIALLPVFGNTQITFEHITLEEALKKGKEQNKPVFVDVYAEWCGPCKRMAATTFVDPNITEYFNKEFISVKIDGEKADGPNVMMKYQISAYPTLLFFYPDGTLANKFVGGMDVPGLKQLGIRTAHPEEDKLYIGTKAFHKSKKTRDDLKKFILVMSTERSDSLSYYTKEYYKQYPELDLKDQAELQVFLSAENNYLSKTSQEFLKNIKSYEQNLAFEKIKLFINASFDEAIQKSDFAICETASRALFVPLNELGMQDLPSIDEFLEYMKSEFYGH